MKKRFLYLDDNDKITRDGDVELLNTVSTKIFIETDYPCSWRQRTKQIIQDISNLDGLILDWELTNKSEYAKEGTTQAEDVDFSAESLAEHIRISVVKEGIKDIPLILCSADKNKTFSRARNTELTSKGLFDLSFIKSDFFVHISNIEKSENQLFDLADSYSYFQSSSSINIYSALNITEAESTQIDIRFIEAFESRLKNNTTHDLVRFLLTEFIQVEGILISEEVVAARLGIDIQSSHEGWGLILNELKNDNIIYKGVLSNGWNNFWSFKLINWWNEKISISDLRSTSATERVSQLNAKYDFKLTPVKKIKFCSSDEFWTICFGTKHPIDNVEGFRIGEQAKSPWVEIQYVSGFAELEKESIDAWKINVLDRERYNHFRALIKDKK